MPVLTKSRRRTAYRQAINRLESLESRTLLSSVTGYLPDSFTAGSGAYDTSGRVWFANVNGPDGGSIDQVVNGAIVTSIDVGDTRPKGIVASPNGKLFFIDDNTGNIDEVDPSNPSAGAIVFAVPNDQPAYSEIPTNLTVSGNGAVWFTAQGAANNDSSGISRRTDVIGRLDPSTGSFSFNVVNNTDSTINTAEADSISAFGSDSAYIGFFGADDFNFSGQNRIGIATFSGGSVNITGLYNINTGDANADANGSLTSVATAPDGSLWFNLANINLFGSQSQRPQSSRPADQIVHATLNPVTGQLDQTAYVLSGATVDNPLFVNVLAVDGNGRVWFNEAQGNATGYFDTHATTNPFTYFSYPDGPDGPTTAPEALAVSQNPTVTDAWVTTESDGFTLVQIHPDTSSGSTPPPFAGTANNLTGPENIAMNNVVVANFTAPAGTYTASVAWGDGTTSAGTVTQLPNGSYQVSVASKTFATQGLYSGVVTIDTSSNTLEGTLNFTSSITDTPLVVTSDSVQTIVLRIVDNTMTFTDDINASASQFTVTVNWGDGTTSKGLIIRDPFDAGTFLMLSAHIYKKKGTYSVTTTVSTSEVGASPTSESATKSVTVS